MKLITSGQLDPVLVEISWQNLYWPFLSIEVPFDYTSCYFIYFHCDSCLIFGEI